MSSTRRPYQDYSAWPAYGTKAWWAEVFANKPIALELFAQRLSQSGCVNPLERTSADISAGILAARYGAAAAALGNEDIQNCYTQFKASLQCVQSQVEASR
jgi:hypothetical protein